MTAGTRGAVLITGCSTGIGHATALRLADAGHTVYATVHTRHDVDDLEAAGCRVRVLDVTDAATMPPVLDEIEAEAGGLAVLVNNAGYGLEGPVEEISIQDMRDQFETNLFGPTRLTQLALPGMRRRGDGLVINVSSVGGRITVPGGGAYHASKHALEALTDVLRLEAEPFGVDVVLLEPGAIRSDWVEHAVTEMRRNQPADTPYAPLYDAIETRLRGAHEGIYALTAADADSAARTIARIVSRPRRRTRYVVPRSAAVFVAARRFLPDSAWDALMRRIFHSPDPATGTRTARPVPRGQAQ